MPTGIVLEDRVTLAHGAGGKETEDLVRKLFSELLPRSLWSLKGGVGLEAMDDAASIPLPGGRHLIVTADSYTVKPLRFPGGDLGRLAASGTINDVLMMGGRPIAMLDAIVVEEGFSLKDLWSIVGSMTEILGEEGVALIGGDFKVMPHGDLDSILVATMGIGVAEKPIVDSNLRPGDKVIVSGNIGEHGAVIMALQQGLSISSGELRSDASPLTRLMLPLLERYGDSIHAARDPTRGGLAMTLNDWAQISNTTIYVWENAVPIREPVRAYSEMLGIDPFTLASEGVAVLGVDPSMAEEMVEYMHELGFRDAGIIGEVRLNRGLEGLVVLETVSGGRRILDQPRGELVPRIC